MKVEIYAPGGHVHSSRVLLDGQEIPVRGVKVEGKVGELFAVTFTVLAKDLAVMIQEGAPVRVVVEKRPPESGGGDGWQERAIKAVAISDQWRARAERAEEKLEQPGRGKE
jgi:hypothetical protein